MRKTFYLLILVLISVNLSSQKSETGFISVKVPRGQKSIEQSVNFQRQYFSIPKILLSLRGFDLSIEDQFGFSLTVQEVNLEGFTFVINVNEFSDLYQLGINYFASTESNIQLFDFRVDISQIAGNRGKDFLPNEMELPYEEIGATVFLNGFQFSKKSNYLLDLRVLQIQPSSVLYQVADRNGTAANFDWIQFTIVATNAEFFNSQRYQRQSTRADDNFAYGTGDRSVTFELESPANPEDLNLFGISGFFASNSKRLTLNIEEPSIHQETTDYIISLQNDAVVTRFPINQMYYTPSVDCAVLYTECGFQGDSIQVCEDRSINSFEEQNWEGVQIKSVTVPFGRTLTLYDKNDLKGPSFQISEDKECLEEHEWIFQ